VTLRMHTRCTALLSGGGGGGEANTWGGEWEGGGGGARDGGIPEAKTRYSTWKPKEEKTDE